MISDLSSLSVFRDHSQIARFRLKSLGSLQKRFSQEEIPGLRVEMIQAIVLVDAIFNRQTNIVDCMNSTDKLTIFHWTE